MPGTRDRHPERPRVWSELLQSVESELVCCQDEVRIFLGAPEPNFVLAWSCSRFSVQCCQPQATSCTSAKKERTLGMAGPSCYTGAQGTQRLARASRRYFDFGQTQHHKQVVGRAQLEGLPSEALSHVNRTIQEEDDSLGYSWKMMSTSCEDMPSLRFRKTETGKISRERTSSKKIWRPHLLGSWVREDLATKPSDPGLFWMEPRHI